MEGYSQLSAFLGDIAVFCIHGLLSEKGGFLACLCHVSS